MPVDELVKDALRSVDLDVARADELAVVHRRARRRVRVRRAAGTVLASIAVVLAGIGAVALRDDQHEVRTRMAEEPEEQGMQLPPPPEPLPEAEYEPFMRVVQPEGPITDGQVIRVEVPYTDHHAMSVEVCVTQGAGDYCDLLGDPRGGSTWEESEGGARSQTSLIVNRVIETAAGTFDCGDPSTPCHLRVERDYANLPALRSDDLRFVGEPFLRPSLSVTPGKPYAERQQVAVQVERAPIDESVLAAREQGLEPEWATLALRLCVVHAAPGLNDCTPLGSITPDDEGAGEGTVTMPRELFSYDGWQDCAEVRCAVVVSRTMDYLPTPGGSVSWPQDLALELVVADPGVPASPRPELRIVEPGPYDDEQQVTIVGEHFPPGFSEPVGVCHDVPKVMEGYSFCVYRGGFGTTADADGRFELTMKLPRTMLSRGDVGEPPFVDCAERSGRCYLGIVTGEGMPTMVRTPIEMKGD